MIIVLCLPAAGDTYIVSGRQWASYKIKTNPGIHFRSYSNNGFSQQVVKTGENLFQIEVTSTYDELQSDLEFPLVYHIPKWLKPFTEASEGIESGNPEIVKHARGLARGNIRQHEVVSSVLRWIRNNVEYDLDANGPTNAIDLFRKKRGYCIGYSQLAVAILRALGIPSRTVHGIYFDPQKVIERNRFHEVSLDGVSLHRWIEVYYPDKGWVFSDPRKSLNHITSDYIVIKHQNGQNDYRPEKMAGTAVKLLDEVNWIKLLDKNPDDKGALYIRPNRFQRVNPAVEVLLLNQGMDFRFIEVVVASLDSVLKITPGNDGTARFIGMKNGEYELKIRYNGKLKYIKKFSLERTQDLHFDIMLKMEDSADE